MTIDGYVVMFAFVVLVLIVLTLVVVVIALDMEIRRLYALPDGDNITITPAHKQKPPEEFVSLGGFTSYSVMRDGELTETELRLGGQVEKLTAELAEAQEQSARAVTMAEKLQLDLGETLQRLAEYRAALTDIANMRWEDAFGVTEIASGDLDRATLDILAELGARKEDVAETK